ncbi:acylglycerol kinase, mitochondrial-like [Lingula anatina]|uniref:Acylglycerol kinase, mitochondrial n=1 Tax=Lingula anatina TaxID=7574 RepID=A0A1S3I8M5_LINAN|nr:acylglycerol kinase, mitochondrial-like [Lingula anatina]|eukprot:XP_013393739.1 acylglycerol kinase, mitochondrial-like [Lingula anatina]
MAKVVKKLQDNWKKLVLFSGASAYGVKYATNKYEELDIRRQYCKKAQAYGQQCLYPNENPRKVTVFLNPAANNRKCTQLFDKNAAPLFHLAGLDVTVIKTEREGQAKAYMDVIGLEDTDAIVVAGGDGTVAEVMTGLLRRKDQDFVKRISIGILPLGETNSLARSIFSDTASQVRWICESALAVVEGLKRPIDLMAITGNEGKTVYAASSIQWSHFRDAETTKSKYWYFGPLKHRWTYVWATVKKWPPELKARLSYILPCSGCSKCETPPPPEEKKQRGWLSFLLPPPKKKEPVKDYAHIINEECGVEHKLDVNTSELTVLSSNLLEKQLS